MKFLVVLPLLLISFNASAQNISAGLRTGIISGWSLNGTPPSYSFYDNAQPFTQPETELFVRYSLKGRWAFEVGATYNSDAYSQFYSSTQYNPSTGSHMDIETVVRGRSTNMFINTTALYDFSFWKNDRLKSYIGLSYCQGYDRISSEGKSFGYRYEVDYPKTVENRWSRYHLGVSQSFSYQVNSQLAVSSNISFRINPNEIQEFSHSHNAINSFIHANVGLGYCFNLK